MSVFNAPRSGVPAAVIAATLAVGATVGVASSSARSAASSSRSTSHTTLTAGVLHAFTGQTHSSGQTPKMRAKRPRG